MNELRKLSDDDAKSNLAMYELTQWRKKIDTYKNGLRIEISHMVEVN